MTKCYSTKALAELLGLKERSLRTARYKHIIEHKLYGKVLIWTISDDELEQIRTNRRLYNRFSSRNHGKFLWYITDK